MVTCTCSLGVGVKVPGQGPVPCSVMLIGEAPGRTEAARGVPFVGDAGRLLDNLLRKARLRREDVYVTNVVGCRPPLNRAPKPEEIAACLPRLEAEIELVRPQVIVLLGATAVGVFLPGTALKSYHGVSIQRKGITYVPMYHPAATFYNPTLRAVVYEDWERLTTLRVSIEEVPDHVSALDAAALRSLDTETEFDGTLLSLSTATHSAAYHVEAPEEIPKADLIVGHNLKFDIKALRKAGLDLPRGQRTADTMVAAFLIGERQLGLKPLVLRYIGKEMTTLGSLLEGVQDALTQEHISKATLPEGSSLAKSLAYVKEHPSAITRRWALRQAIGEPPKAGIRDVMERRPGEFRQYALDDAVGTLQLWKILEPLIPCPDLFWDVEMPLVRVLVGMEERGMAIDRERAGKVRSEFEERSGSILTHLHSMLGEFNPGSSVQVSRVLFDVLGLPPLGFTETGERSTAKWVLEELVAQEPLVQSILDYRHLTKLITTYLGPWERGGTRVYPSFNQVRQHDEEDAVGATATGRLSSSGPNWQQVPKRTAEGKAVRSCVVAQPGYKLVAIDLAQIELVVAAVLAREPTLLAAFLAGRDVHQETADFLGIDRDAGKQINFAWFYGIRAGKLAKLLRCSVPTAQTYLNAFEAKYPSLRVWWNGAVDKATKIGYAETKFGRRRYLPELKLATTQEEWYAAAKRAANMEVQGTVADMAKRCLVALDAQFPDSLVCQVHDEFVLEVPEGTAVAPILGCVVATARGGWDEFAPLINAEATEGTNWGEMK